MCFFPLQVTGIKICDVCKCTQPVVYVNCKGLGLRHIPDPDGLSNSVIIDVRGNQIEEITKDKWLSDYNWEADTLYWENQTFASPTEYRTEEETPGEDTVEYTTQPEVKNTPSTVHDAQGYVTQRDGQEQEARDNQEKYASRGWVISVIIYVIMMVSSVVMGSVMLHLLKKVYRQVQRRQDYPGQPYFPRHPRGGRRRQAPARELDLYPEDDRLAV